MGSRLKVLSEETTGSILLLGWPLSITENEFERITNGGGREKGYVAGAETQKEIMVAWTWWQWGLAGRDLRGMEQSSLPFLVASGHRVSCSGFVCASSSVCQWRKEILTQGPQWTCPVPSEDGSLQRPSWWSGTKWMTTTALFAQQAHSPPIRPCTCFKLSINIISSLRPSVTLALSPEQVYSLLLPSPQSINFYCMPETVPSLLPTPWHQPLLGLL